MEETTFEAIITRVETTRTGQQVDGLRVKMSLELPESELPLLAELAALPNRPLLVKIRPSA